MKRSRNIALVLCFTAALVAPTIASIFGWNPCGTIDEKRVLSKKPDGPSWARTSLAKVPTLTQAWEKHFSDHFGLRKLLIGGHRLANYYLFRASLNPSVVVGESDGDRRWLYFDAGVTGDGVGLESVRGLKPYIPVQLAAIAERLKQVTALVRARGIPMVIIVSPDKQAVYPEYLPRDKRPAPGSISRLDQFWSMASALDSVPLVDLRDLFKQVKPQQQLYYPSDSHWNWQAGVLAYQAAARILAKQDPTREVLPMEKLEWVLGPPRPGDLTAFMGLPAIGGDRDRIPTLASRAALGARKRGKLLVVGDSFYESIGVFFEMQFEKVTSRYVCRGTREELLTPGLLDAEKPDVIILQSVERYWTMD